MISKLGHPQQSNTRLEPCVVSGSIYQHAAPIATEVVLATLAVMLRLLQLKYDLPSNLHGLLPP